MKVAVEGGYVEIPDASTGAPFMKWYTDPKDVVSDQLPIPGQWLGAVTRGGKQVCAIFVPTSGSGVFALETSVIGFVENLSDVDARCRFGLGVTKTIPGDQPMYPYKGVMHHRGDYPSAFFSVPAHSAVQIADMRLDIVDEELQGDQPIAGWPNWSMQPGEGPGIVVCGGCDTPGAEVVVRDLQVVMKQL